MVFLKYEKDNRLGEGKCFEAEFLRMVANMNYHPELHGYDFIFAYFEHDDKSISWNKKNGWREHRRN